MKQIEIKHQGPIDECVIPVPADGGLVVITGGNDIGKSEALKAVAKLCTGEGKLTTQRGYEGIGTVAGLGVHVASGARTMRQGSLEVDDMTAAIDLADIVRPPRAEPETRDAIRIRTLVVASGAEPDMAQFERIVATVDGLTLPEAVGESTDPVQMAGRVKRAIEDHARGLAGEAVQRERRAVALVANVPEDLDLTGVHDREALDKGYRSALEKASEMRARFEQHERLREQAKAASDELDRLTIPGEGELDAARAAEAEAVRIAEEAAAALEIAEEKRRAACQQVDRLTDASDAAGVLRETVNLARALSDTPTPEEIVEADAVAARSYEAIERGARIRDALAARKEADEEEKQAADYRKREAEARAAAHGVEEVLASILREAGIEGLAIVDGRLMTTDVDPPVPFDERSPGARTRIAWQALLPLARRRVTKDRPAVLVLAQDVYQELDYEARRELAEWAAGSKVIIYTGLATSGEMRVVTVTPDSDDGIR